LNFSNFLGFIIYAITKKMAHLALKDLAALL